MAAAHGRPDIPLDTSHLLKQYSWPPQGALHGQAQQSYFKPNGLLCLEYFNPDGERMEGLGFSNFNTIFSVFICAWITSTNSTPAFVALGRGTMHDQGWPFSFEWQTSSWSCPFCEHPSSQGLWDFDYFHVGWKLWLWFHRFSSNFRWLVPSLSLFLALDCWTLCSPTPPKLKNLTKPKTPYFQ